MPNIDDDRLAQWSEYSPIVQEIVGSIRSANEKNMYPSSRIHNTSLVSAYFGLDKCV
jgi:hypothetical protein